MLSISEITELCSQLINSGMAPKEEVSWQERYNPLYCSSLGLETTGVRSEKYLINVKHLESRFEGPERLNLNVLPLNLKPLNARPIH